MLVRDDDLVLLSFLGNGTPNGPRNNGTPNNGTRTNGPRNS